MVECHVVVDSCLNLLVHGFFHLSFSMASVAVQYHQKNENGNSTDHQNMTHTIAMIVDIVDSNFVVILKVRVLQNWFAHIRYILESSTNGIHNCLRLHLSSVSGIVNDNRWNYISTMSIPVIDFLIDDLILDFWLVPLVLVLGSEAITNALHGFIPIKSS